MENSNSNSKLKAIIIVLSILLAASLAYMFKLSSDNTQKEEKITSVTSEKEQFMKELEAAKAQYDIAIAENTSMSEELKAEREKVVKLMEDLKKSEANTASLTKFRNQYNDLKKRMDELMLENEKLKKENIELAYAIDSTRMVLDEAQQYNQVLVGQNEELSKTVEKASKLSILNLTTGAYKVRNSGKEVETSRARRADILKVSFTIAENKVAQTGDRMYYVQIIDANNNVLGEKKTEMFGSNSLTYSFTTIVRYENSTVSVSENLPGENFDKGTYFVNIFDSKGELAANTSFSLK